MVLTNNSDIFVTEFLWLEGFDRWQVKGRNVEETKMGHSSWENEPGQRLAWHHIVFEKD